MSMTWFDKRTARVLATIIVFAAAGGFIYGARTTLIVFIFSIFFAYMLEPLVERLQQRRIARHSRGIAILEIYLVMLLGLALAGLFAGPKLVAEGRKLSASAPTFMDEISSGKIAQRIGSKRGWSAQTQQRAQQFLASHREQILRRVNDFASRLGRLSGMLIWLALVPIFAVFFLKDGAKMKEAVVQAVDRRSQRQFLRGLLGELDEMLAGYIRAQLLLAGLAIVVYTGVLLLLRVPYAIALGVGGGCLEFIPVVGPLVAALAILGISFLANYPHLWLVLIFLGAWRGMQDYYNSPRIMGKHLELHPLAAIFAVLVGGEIAGVIGVYLSIPIMAAARILWRRYQRFAAVEPATAIITPPETRAA